MNNDVDDDRALIRSWIPNALTGLGASGLSVWAPNANLFRDPRWGRGHETVGECPVLSAVLQTQYVKALQYGREEAAGEYLKLIATPKHFAGCEDRDARNRHL